MSTAAALHSFYKTLPPSEQIVFNNIIKQPAPATTAVDNISNIEGPRNLEKVIQQLSSGKSLKPLIYERY